MTFAACAASMTFAAHAQVEISDADLVTASAGRVVTLGSPTAPERTETLPLEVYVARVLAGEAEPGAPAAARQALAIAVRTYAIVNAGRHRGLGFDLCDTTHCQVPRAATAATRRAALDTAGQVLMFRGAPADVYYSASCGGRTEQASAVWPTADVPYLRSVEDDVHDGDEPWTLSLTLEQTRQILIAAGFQGDRLRGVRVEARTPSGRVARLALAGMQPPEISGDAFRMAVGAAALRSTAFSMRAGADVLHFTGRGYGHGVGMCVVGAGRRARRGENAAAILRQYYPGLTVSALETLAASSGAPRSGI
jgi:stage II sporulation protein D